jgi:hypothetical protein
VLTAASRASSTYPDPLEGHPPEARAGAQGGGTRGATTVPTLQAQGMKPSSPG